MGRYFGTDGFRGEANGILTAEKAFQVGRFLGAYFQKNGNGKIALGKDARRSSYMFEAALVAGIVSSGSDAYLLHVTTTPSVSYVVRSEGFDCGVMISASHNLFYDNGIKLFNRQGEKMEEEVLARIEDYLDGKNEGIIYAKRDKIGRSVDHVAGRNRYVGYLISLGIHSFKGKRVGLDCANGSAWHIAKSVFDALGATTYVIGATPDGTNINADCGSTHIEGLQSFVKEKGLDVGFAFDGDADRCLCVDERGKLVNGDGILYLCAQYMRERGELLKNTLVATVMSNMGLYKSLDALGISYEKTPVGDKYVYEKMSQSGVALGGEQSGHVIFSKYGCSGDGILTALKVMEVMLEKKSALSALVADMVVFPQVLKNVQVKDKRRTLLDEKVRFAVTKAEERLGDKGRILLRASGTEPVIRVMAEGENEELCLMCVNEILSAINGKR